MRRADANETAEQQLYQTLEHNLSNPAAPVVTANGVREKTIDPLALTKRQQALIPEQCTPYWARKPAVWSEIEGGDRVEELIDTFDGARLVKDADGKTVQKGRDLVLMAIPAIHNERQQAAIDNQYRDVSGNLVQDGDGNLVSREVLFDSNDAEQVRQRAVVNHQLMLKSGMVGPSSPTNGMSYLEAVGRYTPQEIEAEEARFRQGTKHKTMSQADWGNMIAGDSEKGRVSKGYGKKYAENYNAAFGGKQAAGKG